ncbi:MAG: hypothetical protein ABSH56_35845, partial [Bryobacteraceae bacterium]
GLQSSSWTVPPGVDQPYFSRLGEQDRERRLPANAQKCTTADNANAKAGRRSRRPRVLNLGQAGKSPGQITCLTNAIA